MEEELEEGVAKRSALWVVAILTFDNKCDHGGRAFGSVNLSGLTNSKPL